MSRLFSASLVPRLKASTVNFLAHSKGGTEGARGIEIGGVPVSPWPPAFEGTLQRPSKKAPTSRTPTVTSPATNIGKVSVIPRGEPAAETGAPRGLISTIGSGAALGSGFGAEAAVGAGIAGVGA